MQIEISQSREFKYSIVYVVKVAISYRYNCFPTIMQHFVVKKCFYFKTPDGAASISSPSYLLQFYLGHIQLIYVSKLRLRIQIHKYS